MQEYGFFKENLGCIPEDIMRMSERKLEKIYDVYTKTRRIAEGIWQAGNSGEWKATVRLQMTMVIFKGVHSCFTPN
jgi:hypothetical protein